MTRRFFLFLLVLFWSGLTWAQPTPATLIRSDLKLANSSPALADLNGDGKMDLVFVTFEPIETPGPPGRGVVRPMAVPCVIEEGTLGKGNLDGYRLAAPAAQGVRGVLKVHALDGAAFPPYSAELPQFWPRSISADDACLGTTSLHPTVAVATLNPFSCDELDVVVGYNRSPNEQVFAFRPDGSNLPGWPRSSQFPPYWNAPLVADVNLQGVRSVVAVDQSTYLQRYNPFGKKPQCQFVGDPVASSPLAAILRETQADPDPALGTGVIPNEAAAGVPATPGTVRVYNSYGFNTNCTVDPPPDMLFEKPEDLLLRSGYTSSPAAARLTDTRVQDMVVQSKSNKIQVFLGRTTLPNYFEFPLPTGTTVPSLGQPNYSSPAIVDLEGCGVRRDIVVGTDSGQVVALRFTGTALNLLWQTPVLDTDASISSSPIVARLNGNARPYVIAATDAGNIHILDPGGNPPGSIVQSYTLAGGDPTGRLAIWCSAALSAREPNKPGGDNQPMIVAGNGRGLFKIVLNIAPFGVPFQGSGAQWPTFHGNNARTGSLSYEDLSFPTRGSVAGIVVTCTLVELRSNTTPFPIVNDGYGSPAVANSADLSQQGNRYLFELIPPGTYRVRFNGDAATDKVITVTAGHMTRVDGDCRTCTP